MPLFGWRKRKEQTRKQAEKLPNTTSTSSTPPSTSKAQVAIKGLSANEANTREDDESVLTKAIAEASVSTPNQLGKYVFFIYNRKLF